MAEARYRRLGSNLTDKLLITFNSKAQEISVKIISNKYIYEKIHTGASSCIWMALPPHNTINYNRGSLVVEAPSSSSAAVAEAAAAAAAVAEAATFVIKRSYGTMHI